MMTPKATFMPSLQARLTAVTLADLVGQALAAEAALPENALTN